MTGSDPAPAPAVTGSRAPAAGSASAAGWVRAPGSPGGISPRGLARRSVGPIMLWLIGVSASAPMTVLAGGVIATFATTGVIAVPLSFPLLAALLGLFAVGYCRLAAAIGHAAPFAALLSHGLGRTTGTAGAAVAVLSYNAVQIALYGLLGATAAGLLGGPWWAWAAAAWTVVGVVGYRGLRWGGPVIAVVLACELALIVLIDITGLTHPARTDLAGLLAPWRPDLLVGPGVGGVIAIGVAGFLGFETPAAFAEETRTPRSLPRAIAATLGFLGVFYGVSAWAVAVAVGPDRIIDAARDPGSGIPFTILATNLGMFGPTAAAAGTVLLAASVLGAMIALHHAIARYVHALAREHVLPAGLAALNARAGAPDRARFATGFVTAADRPGPGRGRLTPRRGGVPTAASAAQSAVAVAAIAAAAMAGVDPMALFTVLATLSGLGLLTVMTATCLAVIAYHRSRGGHRTIRHRPSWRARGRGRGAWPPAARPEPGDGDAERLRHPGPGPVAGWWVRVGAPTLGAAALTAALTITVANLTVSLADPTGVGPVALPLLIAATAAAGAGRARRLRRRHRAAWTAIGHGQPPPLAVRDAAIADLEL